jgi:predicted nucleotidyltransferase component of viral defense system
MRPREVEHAALAPAQRRVLDALARSELGRSFYLSGGAALAGFYLGHRTSRDLDLFSPTDVPFETVRSFLGSIPGLVVKSFQRLYDRRIFLVEVDGESLEVEFTTYPFPHVEAPVRLASGLAVDALRDIAANKAAALADRHEPKDEIDVVFLLRSGAVADIAEAAALAERKFGTPGFRRILERRLLAVSRTHPPTTPPIAHEEIERTLRDAARSLVRGGSDG